MAQQRTPRVDPLMVGFLVAAIVFVTLVLWVVVRFSSSPPAVREPTATVQVIVQPTGTPRTTLEPRTPTATPVAENVLLTPSATPRAPTETPRSTATAAPSETPKPATQRG